MLKPLYLVLRYYQTALRLRQFRKKLLTSGDYQSLNLVKSGQNSEKTTKTEE